MKIIQNDAIFYLHRLLIVIMYIFEIKRNNNFYRFTRSIVIGKSRTIFMENKKSGDGPAGAFEQKVTVLKPKALK